MKLKPKHLKSFWNKKNILFVSLFLLLAIGVGSTLAYLTGYDGQKTYTFNGANVVASYNVKGVLTENKATAVPSGTYFGYKGLYVNNKGEADGYIRVALTLTWVRDDQITSTGGAVKDPANQIVHKNKPVEGTDYIATYNKIDWTYENDGYWYTIKPVKAGNESPVLLTEFKSVLNNPQAPEGYALQWTLISNIIQANPGDTWQTAWERAGAPQAQSRPTEAQ